MLDLTPMYERQNNGAQGFEDYQDAYGVTYRDRKLLLLEVERLREMATAQDSLIRAQRANLERLRSVENAAAGLRRALEYVADGACACEEDCTLACDACYAKRALDVNAEAFANANANVQPALASPNFPPTGEEE